MKAINYQMTQNKWIGIVDDWATNDWWWLKMLSNQNMWMWMRMQNRRSMKNSKKEHVYASDRVQ